MSANGYNAFWIAAAQRALRRAERTLAAQDAAALVATSNVRHALAMLEKGPASCDCEKVYIGGGWSAEDQRRADARKAAAATIAASPRHRHFKFRYHRNKRA